MNPAASGAVYAIKHAIMRTISVICVLLVIAGIGWAVYRTFIKPRDTQTTHQTADKISNYNIALEKESCWIDVGFFGVKLKAICFQKKVDDIVYQKENK